jgi:zinc protease
VTYISVAIKSGSADDPRGKEGLAWLTANYLKHGTKSYTQKQIEERIADLGGRLNIRVDREVIEISGRVLSDKLEDYYEIFKEIILTPTFSFAELSALKLAQEQALQQILRDDASLSLEALIHFLYSGHPYSHPVTGYFSSIEKLTNEDARTFYSEHFRSGNMICGLAGDYPDGFLNTFTEDIAQLPSSVPSHKRPPVSEYKKRSVVLVEKAGRDQAQIRIGRVVDYTRDDPDWYALQVANSYLGRHREGFGRLFITVREERGLSYGAYSYLEHFEQAGWSNNPLPLTPMNPQYFSMWTYPRRVNTEFAIKMMVYELEKLILTGIDPVAMETVKKYEVNHFPFLIESIEQELSMALEAVYYNQPDFVKGYDERIKTLTSAAVNTAVFDRWSSEDLLILVVTDDAEEMKTTLLSPETQLELPSGATETGLKRVNDEVKSFDLGLNPEDIVIVNADQLFR